MLRVQLEDAFGAGVELAVLLQQPLQMHVEIALIGNEADRAVGQPLRAADILHCLAERQLEDRDQAGELGRRLRLCRCLLLIGGCDLVEIGAAAGGGFERLFLVGADRGDPELVDRIGQQQHLDAAGAEPLDLRALLQQLQIVAGDCVDRLLSRPHRGDVIVERDQPVARRRPEADKRQDRVALLAVLVEPFLQHGAEIVPELGIFLGRLAGLLGQF